ncbi:MAG: anthranilate phosphoribosyltransferase [Ignavibacteria bacterium CG2_30_36_16]|nr:MAG: anthranilate phosphoribosyltransferase [Ignavibacteria bacterium CG2_30_36_16]PJB02171.1 MAG: anthranilate phosphoribosyltransferase [Ignavibacteria bacterium CG_4_9_14_3_um_filter_36_18]
MKMCLQKITEKEHLSFDEAYELMNKIMSGKANNSEIAGLLMALKVKGETSEEIAGFATAMRANSIKIKCDDENVIDVCGTGGDNSGSFNISTAVAFVAAGAGVSVAKHGNRSVSSKSGSADVLQQLGINIELTREESEAVLNKIGVAFLFAPLYHPAMKYAAHVRRELGVKTVFNLLGPLTNPAGVQKQIIGTYNNSAAKTLAGAASYLDHKRVCFLCSEDKYDEIYLGGITGIHEYNCREEIKYYELTNESFFYPNVTPEQIQGGSPEVNAKIIMDVFENRTPTGAFHTVAANTALALYAAGFSNNLNECKAAAEESILSGAALKKLNTLKYFRIV